MCNYCPVLVSEVAGKVKPRTSPTLLIWLCSVYRMIFPCAIRSD